MYVFLNPLPINVALTQHFIGDFPRLIYCRLSRRCVNELGIDFNF